MSVKFTGRCHELDILRRECERTRASLIAIYGRRRVGKTRLVEEFCKNKTYWKFDGLENQPKAKQIKLFLKTLAGYTKNPLVETAHCKDWIDVFKLLDSEINKTSHKHNMIVFFDELPYMANRRHEMISDLKWAWDNLWSGKEALALIMCGSIASFMVDSVINSSALYGRITLEICLNPLSLSECYDFFLGKKSQREIIELYMFCGGIPAYLTQFDNNESVALNINRLAFCKDGYFTTEFERIFKDVFHEDRIYKKIILLLCKYKSLKIAELLKIMSMTAGSSFNRYLDNLEIAGFVRGYAPSGRPESSKLKRYKIDDEYIHFYFKFIKPNSKKIASNTTGNLFSRIISSSAYQSWAGFAFERLCLKHIGQIMRALKIDQLVTDFGPYFTRDTNTKDSAQIDLILYRHDSVVTVCEMKYYNKKIGKWIIDEVEKKLSTLSANNKSIEKVLITTEGITDDLEDANYFSNTLLTDTLFD